MLSQLFTKGKPDHDTPCLFKCTDFTTEIVGRYDANRAEFYVQRGDGTRYGYGHGVEWFKPLALKENLGVEVEGYISDIGSKLYEHLVIRPTRMNGFKVGQRVVATVRLKEER